MRGLATCVLVTLLLACDSPPSPASASASASVSGAASVSGSASGSASASGTVSAAASAAASGVAGAAAIARLTAKADALVRRRYMERSCRRAKRPGWGGYPLERCRYQVAEPTGHKSAVVVMLNPSAAQLARWIVTSCAVAGDDSEDCVDRLYRRILMHSGAQFPVGGIVLEDVRPRDGRFEMYCFRDGVRVEVDGFDSASTETPSDEDLRRCLDGEVVSVGAFARIQGTTPSEYRANGGSVDVGDDVARKLAWLTVVRQLYQQAWASDHNALMVAWVRANR